MDGLAVLALIGLLGAALLLLAPPAPGGREVRLHLLRCGALVLLLDLVVELVGTHVGMWSYNRSVYFLAGRVPIELPGLFGGGGVLLAALHLWLGRRQRAPSAGLVLLTLMGLGLLLYLWRVAYLGNSMSMLVVTLPFGLWGLNAIQEDVHRSHALLLAAGIAVLDHLVETWIVGSGSYGYAGGFRIETPLTYALLVLGVCGWLDARRRRVLATSRAPM